MERRELKETLPARVKWPSLQMERVEEVVNEDEDEDEKQIEALEKEVKEMAQKIVHFRSTVPERLADIVSSASLALLRPELSLALTSVASQSTREGPQPELTGSSSTLTEAGEMEFEKLYHLKKKAMSSMTEAPLILKRLNDCLARLDKIEQNNVNIHSSFKRRKK